MHLVHWRWANDCARVCGKPDCHLVCAVLGVRGKLLLRLMLTMLCDAGYIMDRRVGNTKKMGALFGILAAIGVWVPQPGSFSFAVLTSVNWLREKVTG